MIATQLAFPFLNERTVRPAQLEIPLPAEITLPYQPHAIESVATFRAKGFPLEERLVFDESRAMFLRNGRIVVSRPYDFAFFDSEGKRLSPAVVTQREIDEAVMGFEAEEK